MLGWRGAGPKPNGARGTGPYASAARSLPHEGSGGTNGRGGVGCKLQLFFFFWRGRCPLACEMSKLFSSFAHFRLECVTSANAALAELKADKAGRPPHTYQLLPVISVMSLST